MWLPIWRCCCCSWGGLILSTRVKQEIFPEFVVETITVSVLYRGASPAEVEQGIILSIEDEVRGLDGVKEVTALATESRASVTIELLTGTDTGKALQDVKKRSGQYSVLPRGGRTADRQPG